MELAAICSENLLKCSGICRHFGVSRKTFDKWKRRFAEQGEAAWPIDRARRSDAPAPRRQRSSARSCTCAQATAIRFIDEVRRLPFRIHVVQTDNGAECQSRFHWHLETQDIRHTYIRPRTPHLNGKVERSHRGDDLFNDKLREWEDYYNYHRPHGALDGQTPYERLLTKTGAGPLPTS